MGGGGVIHPIVPKGIEWPIFFSEIGKDVFFFKRKVLRDYEQDQGRPEKNGGLVQILAKKKGKIGREGFILREVLV